MKENLYAQFLKSVKLCFTLLGDMRSKRFHIWPVAASITLYATGDNWHASNCSLECLALHARRPS
jgi:hypothetical protein